MIVKSNEIFEVYTLNEVLNKPKKNTKMSKSFIETCTSNIIDDPKQIANKFNDYFINIRPSLANKIKQNENNSFDKYLTGSYHTGSYKSFP